MYNQCSETYVKMSLVIIPACLPKTKNQIQSELKKTCTGIGLASQPQKRLSLIQIQMRLSLIQENCDSKSKFLCSLLNKQNLNYLTFSPTLSKTKESTHTYSIVQSKLCINTINMLAANYCVLKINTQHCSQLGVPGVPSMFSC